jgi:hypothetical protein
MKENQVDASSPHANPTGIFMRFIDNRIFGASHEKFSRRKLKDPAPQTLMTGNLMKIGK